MNWRRCISYPLPSSGDGILTPQTSALIEAEIGIKTDAAVHSQCLLRVKTRIPHECPHVSFHRLRTLAVSAALWSIKR
jgi:hypothetical protein